MGCYALDVDEAPPTSVIELDDRRRAPLGKLGRREHRRYLARSFPDGTIVLEPAVVISQAQLALYQRPDIIAALQESRAHPERHVKRRTPRRRTDADWSQSPRSDELARYEPT